MSSLPPIDAEGLDGPAAELQALLRSGVKLKNLRLLQVICEHQRELVSVLKINGQQMLAYHGVNEKISEHTSFDELECVTTEESVTGLRFRTQWHLDLLAGAAPDAYVAAANECCARRVRADWIVNQLRTGVRRSVVEGNHRA